MSTRPFPLEKIFGSRTRVKIMTLFTSGVNRPYYVREIARHINERLNAVRRELEILRKIGMLTTHDNKRRKYYAVRPEFFILSELAGIMKKAGPTIEDTLFKNVVRLGDVKFMCVSGYFTGAKESPTDILIIGTLRDDRLAGFIRVIEEQLGTDITYTPMTLNEYRYRFNFNDVFLRRIFSNSYKEVVNKLEDSLQPEHIFKKETAFVVRT